MQFLILNKQLIMQHYQNVCVCILYMYICMAMFCMLVRPRIGELYGMVTEVDNLIFSPVYHECACVNDGHTGNVLSIASKMHACITHKASQ